MSRTLTSADIEHLLADAHSYRSRVIVRATKAPADSEWTTSHGDVLHASAGDWWVNDGDDRWSVAGDIFRDTYEHLDGDNYRKTAIVTAAVVDRAWAVQTLEGLATGRQGDWLVRNPSGECWPVTAEVFERRYEII